MSSVLLESRDWSTLGLETQALGLVLGQQDETRPWHEALASQQPARALELALRAAQYSLRFARAGNTIARVIETGGPSSTGALPSADFWRELRRTIESVSELRAEVSAVAAKHAPTDLRLRAGLAYALPDERAWWTNADRSAALRVTDVETGALMLLALVRRDVASLRHVVWPPPIYTLRSLDHDELAAAHRWCPSLAPGLLALSESPQSISAALRRITRPDSLALVARLQEEFELVCIVRRPAPRAGPMQRLLSQVLCANWDRPTQGSLPRLLRRDERGIANCHELARLRGAIRSRDKTALDDFERQFVGGSLAAFAEHLFVQWLLDGAPQNGDWALEAIGQFPSRASADAIAELARKRRGLSKLPEVLAQMNTHPALTHLASLSRAPECRGERRAIAVLLEKAAARQGLSVHELEDRLFPPLTLPQGATARLEPGLRVVLERDGKNLPLTPDWDAAVAALPTAVRRLERLMCEGPPLSVIAFTETWGMHPLLSVVASHLVWGVFSGETRVDLLIPGRCAPAEFDDAMGLRPLHPTELTPPERQEFGSWRMGRQPFPQIERPCFEENDLRKQDFSPDEFSLLTESLEAAGWERDRGLEAWTRGGDDWSARVGFRNFAMGGELRVVQSDFSIRGSPPVRVVSELHRELTVAAEAANQCFGCVVAYLA